MHKISLVPDVRILPMLGEITLQHERCIAELVDNSVDAFLDLKRNNKLDYSPEVYVNISVNPQNAYDTMISVRDNGPGMTTQKLENAVKAGWSGNDPFSNLGLFGMGFNISTARMGRITRVWTTQKGEKEWRGITIDFDDILKKKSFEVDLLIRDKTDAAISGTEVLIEKMKPDQSAWFSKNQNLIKTRIFLSKAYSTMLRKNGYPISFKLILNGKDIKPKTHCVWGDSGENRTVSSSKYGIINAFQTIDKILPKRKYCSWCWVWLLPDDDTCHMCGEKTHVVERERHIIGWIGILRYLSETDYGIDLIRNGRKIELLNRDFFKWENNGVVEDEYPIDDPRRRGRIVGEIHVDHCRVSYTKDRFYRDDPAWSDMMEIVRGQGPLQPQKAADLGYTQNTSPLYLLYQAFRRSTPQNKIANCYRNLLCVPDNNMAREMALKFEEGDPKYQTDSEWMKLVLAADEELLTPKKKDNISKTQVVEPPKDELSGIDLPDTTSTVSPNLETSTQETPITTYKQTLNLRLCREYYDDKTQCRFKIEAYEVDQTHPAFEGKDMPCILRREPRSVWKFYYNSDHQAFLSYTYEPQDALIAELAFNVRLFAKDSDNPPSFSEILTGLRSKYLKDTFIDIASLSMEATKEIKDIAESLRKYPPEENESYFNELDADDQVYIYRYMAKAGITDSQKQIHNGTFLLYAKSSTVVKFIVSHPEIFFDGKYWLQDYQNIKFQNPEAELIAKQRVLAQYSSLLNDIIWLSEQSIYDLSYSEYDLYLRAKLSLDLLRSYRNE